MRIADNTIQGRDVRNGDLTGADVRNGSLSRNELDLDCPGGSMKAFGGCVSLAPLSPTPYNAAVVRCNEREHHDELPDHAHGRRRLRGVISNASAQIFASHCIVS